MVKPEFFVVGDRGEWLERHVQAFLRAEFVLENLLRLGEDFIDVAAPGFGLEREIGVLDPFQVLEISEAAGGLELVVDVSRRGHRLDFVVDRLELLVFRNDGMRCRLGYVGIRREHHGYRLADEADLLVGQNWLVVEGRPVIGMRNHFAHVIDRDHAKDAGQLPRFANVDGFDAAVRDGAAEYFSVQHAGHPHQMRVFGSAGDFFARLQARYRAADLAASDRIRRHKRYSPFAPMLARL